MKLVRNNIPDIIKKTGKIPIFHIATIEEYKKRLLDKLIEEATEFIQSPSEEELADIYEVLDALIKLYRFSTHEINIKKNAKFIVNGGFDKRLILSEVKKDDTN